MEVSSQWEGTGCQEMKKVIFYFVEYRGKMKKSRRKYEKIMRKNCQIIYR
jgi:hypothetical protein